MSEINYQEAYEREHEKCADLADKIVVLESEKEDLQFKLDRIKKNKFWKATGPARSLIHFAQRQRDRLSHCGGPKDILRKIRNKSRQKSLMESYGTGSFPDAEQRKKEEETIFPYMPKISILVPLWNNKREFQIQMLRHESDVSQLGTVSGGRFRRGALLYRGTLQGVRGEGEWSYRL